MATFVAILCLIVIFACVPLVVIKPHLVFYVFLVSKLFETVFAGYIHAAGNLGMPRTWLPGDMLFLLTLCATFFVNREKHFQLDFIEKCIIVVAVISFISLLQGLTFHFHTALTCSRVIHFVAAMIFSVRYLTTYQRVNNFLKFVIVMLLVMFGLHILVRFGYYIVPGTEELAEAYFWTIGGERGTAVLVPMLYLVLLSVGISMFLNQIGFIVMPVLLLATGAIGIVFSETRSTYGAACILGVSSLIFIRKRYKTFALYMVGGFIVIACLGLFKYDFFERFRPDYTGSKIDVVEAFRGRMGRGGEYSRIISSYKEEPIYLLLGRGVGALHPSVTEREIGLVGYYHSEYLGWLDRNGLVGLFVLLVLLTSVLWRSLILARSNIPQMQYYGITSFLLVISLAGEGIFHPVLSHIRGASVLACFIAIIANWQYIYQSLCQEENMVQTYLYQDCDYVQSYS